jgi:hypothetical protein
MSSPKTDTERLEWLIEHISDPWPISHGEWDTDARAAIDARIEQRVLLEDELKKA